MGTISARKKADGSVSYTAQIRIRRGGEIVHTEAKTFERRPAASAWLKKREKELETPGAIEGAQASRHTLGDAIDRYVEDSRRAMGRTKAQVLATIRKAPIAAQPCDRIGSAEIVEWLQSIEAQPQTVGNYASHLSSIFAVARPAWGLPLDAGAMKDAVTVAKRLGIVGKSKKRERRPTLDELDRLLEHFTDRRKRVPQSMPMVQVILFALFSARRQEEITRIRWEDYEPKHARVLVRDMKNPDEKIGNHTWVDLPPEAVLLVEAMPRRKECIFPYSTDAISANFTRACAFLGIEDLHFHDLRHEGVSRLFEMGWNIPHVAGVSGHRSWNSLKRYTHIRQSGDRYAGWKWTPTAPTDPRS